MLALMMLTLGTVPALAQTPEAPVAPPAYQLTLPAPPRAPNLWLADEQVRADRPANDVFLLGQTVDLASTVQDNAFVAGQTVELEPGARVGGDMMAAGQIVRIDEPVDGDVYAVAGLLEVGPQGVVGGDLYAGGSSIILEGEVLGDVQVVAEDLVVVPGARIGGDLSYEAPEQTTLPSGAVDGTVSFTEMEDEQYGEHVEVHHSEPSVIAQAFFGFLGLTWKYLSGLAAGFVLIALFGDRLSRAAARVRTDMARSVGIGFLGAVVLPIVAVIAMVFIIPIPLSLMTLVLLGVAAYVAKLVVAWSLGDALLQQVRPGALGNPYISLAVGLLPLLLALMVPWLGGLLSLGVVMLGLGALWSGVIRPSSAR